MLAAYLLGLFATEPFRSDRSPIIYCSALRPVARLRAQISTPSVGLPTTRTGIEEAGPGIADAVAARQQERNLDNGVATAEALRRLLRATICEAPRELPN